MVEVALAPEVTAGGKSGDAVRPKSCPWAREICAAKKTGSNKAKMIVRRTGLGFNMSG
jgi:hypothetical protein